MKNGCNACTCGLTMSNTRHGCVPIFEIAHLVVFQQTLDSTGARNRIPFTQTIDQAFIDSMINHADPTKRWYPTPSMKNIDDQRGENKTYEFDDQTTEFLAEGARKFMGMIPTISGPGANSPQMKGIIERVRCGDYSVWIVSIKNQLIGKLSKDGLALEGIEIDEQSISASFKKKTNTVPQHLAVSFNYSQQEQDENLRMFDCAEVNDANLLALRGLYDACYDLLYQSATTLKIRIRTAFGTEQNPITVDGLVTNDFVSADDGAVGQIFNETDNANVAITGLTENPDGTYEITFAAQDLGDILIPYALKAGYDFSCMKENPVDLES